MILHEDKSMKPGWTTPFTDGSGWRGVDAVVAQSEGWTLDIAAFGIAVRRLGRAKAVEPMRVVSSSSYVTSGGVTRGSVGYAIAPQFNEVPTLHKEDFTYLLELALTGNKTAYKALYLMVGNDSRYSEYADTVKALSENY